MAGYTVLPLNELGSGCILLGRWRGLVDQGTVSYSMSPIHHTSRDLIPEESISSASGFDKFSTR